VHEISLWCNYIDENIENAHHLSQLTNENERKKRRNKEKKRREEKRKERDKTRRPTIETLDLSFGLHIHICLQCMILRLNSANSSLVTISGKKVLFVLVFILFLFLLLFLQLFFHSNINYRHTHTHTHTCQIER
jgi:hypothetical protein